MTSGQGGPGNEPKKPETSLFVQPFGPADSIAFAAAVVAMQRCMQMIVFPERFDGIHGLPEEELTDRRRRIEALVQQLLGEVKNMPAEGAPEATEIAGKQLAIRTIEQIAWALNQDAIRSSADKNT